METFDIKYLFQIIKKYKLLIFSSAFIGTLIATFVTFFYLTSIYSASTQILVTQANDSKNVQSSEVQANIQMVNTYSIILKSKDLMKEIAKDYPKYTANEISKNLIVTSDSNSQVINVTVKNQYPRVAVAIANDITDKFIKESKDLIKTNEVSVLSRAYIEDSEHPSGPNHQIHLVIGLLAGLFLAFIIIVLKEMFDTTLKTEESIEKILQLPILGTINHINKPGKGGKRHEKNKNQG